MREEDARFIGSMDDLQRAIEEDELRDAAETGTMTPINYARLRGLHAQRVYRAIRDGKLETKICGCGRKIINVAEADILFKKGFDGTSDAG